MCPAKLVAVPVQAHSPAFFKDAYCVFKVTAGKVVEAKPLNKGDPAGSVFDSRKACKLEMKPLNVANEAFSVGYACETLFSRCRLRHADLARAEDVPAPESDGTMSPCVVAQLQKWLSSAGISGRHMKMVGQMVLLKAVNLPSWTGEPVQLLEYVKLLLGSSLKTVRDNALERLVEHIADALVKRLDGIARPDCPHEKALQVIWEAISNTRSIGSSVPDRVHMQCESGGGESVVCSAASERTATSFPIEVHLRDVAMATFEQEVTMRGCLHGVHGLLEGGVERLLRVEKGGKAPLQITLRCDGNDAACVDAPTVAEFSTLKPCMAFPRAQCQDGSNADGTLFDKSFTLACSKSSRIIWMQMRGGEPDGSDYTVHFSTSEQGDVPYTTAGCMAGVACSGTTLAVGGMNGAVRDWGGKLYRTGKSAFGRWFRKWTRRKTSGRALLGFRLDT
jgi:hypothetical protein